MSTDMSIIETVLATGDLSKLTSEQRVEYYRARCEAAGVNPLFKPFEYLTLNGKMVLYGTKELTSQLRQIHQVSITRVDTVFEGGLCVVTAYAKTAAGKEDSDVGAVPFDDNLKGEARANALLKCVTKAKRRVTLSICGLSELDELEVASIPASRAIRHDADGVVLEPKQLPAPEPLSQQLEQSTVDAYLKLFAAATNVAALTESVVKMKASALSESQKTSLVEQARVRRVQLEREAK